MLPSEIFEIVRKEKLAEKTEGELIILLQGCNNNLAANQYVVETQYAITRIRDELASRRSIKAHKELLEKQDRLDQGQQNLKQSADQIIASAEAIKKSVEKLAKPHLLVWATLVVAIIAAVASVIGYWQQIASVFRAVIP